MLSLPNFVWERAVSRDSVSLITHKALVISKYGMATPRNPCYFKSPMKPLLCALILSALPAFTHAADPAGYLVIKVTRYTYNENYTVTSGSAQSFKVPLTVEFMSNFKHLPNQNSSGTGFCCGVGNSDPAQGGPSFVWWIRKTNDDRWAINMWGHDIETVDGVKIDSGRPGRSENLTIKNWECLDMAYPLTFTRGHDGIKVQFTARYISAKDTKTLDPIPDARVLRANRSPLFLGDDPKPQPLKITCIFQEG